MYQPTATNRARIMREMRTRGRRADYRAQLKDMAIRSLIVSALMLTLAAAYLIATN